MSASYAEAAAFIRAATLAAGPVLEGLAAARGGFMSVGDADALRDAVEDFGRLRAEGERLAARLDCPEFTAWVEDMREVETGPRKIVAGMRPVPAH